MICQLCERSADAYLCPGCSQDTADRLRRLPTLYAALGLMLAPSGSRGGRRSATLVVSPAPLRVDVVDARSNFGILPAWARALADDRGQAAPVPTAEDFGACVTAACTALVKSLDWIASDWPAAGDLAVEVRTLHDDVRTVLEVGDLPARMGRCPAVVEETPCGAELLLPEGVQVLHCAWCGTTYPPGVWAALKVAQNQAFDIQGKQPR